MAAAAELRDETRNVATGRPVEVLPGIYELRESLGPVFDTPDCWVSLWILVDPAGNEPPVMVDSGVPRSTETVILPALQSLGIAPQNLAVIVNTHSHHDHAGSNVQARRATGCQIWIHRDDAAAIEQGSSFGAEPCLPHSADRVLEHGERLRLAGREYEVVHIHGHSPGSIGLYDHQRRVFFSGDALQAQGTSTQGIAGAQDRAAYYGTLDRVDALAIDHLLAAHPYLPFTDSHVQPQGEVRRYLAECRRFFDEIDGEILDALDPRGEHVQPTADAPAAGIVAQGAVGQGPLEGGVPGAGTLLGEGATAGELADRICAARGFPRTCALTAFILQGYLAHLEREQRVQKEGDGPDARWRAVRA
ncbi:MAG: MBL fold metallo-hydrolase, partial [Chloroflexota bacterium]|nr:MBL fold metallo-hydrolase [Chloroflexota bacterium]